MHSLLGLYRQGQFPEVACSAPPHDDPFRISSRPGVDTVEWILGNMALPSHLETRPMKRPQLPPRATTGKRYLAGVSFRVDRKLLSREPRKEGQRPSSGW